MATFKKKTRPIKAKSTKKRFFVRGNADADIRKSFHKAQAKPEPRTMVKRLDEPDIVSKLTLEPSASNPEPTPPPPTDVLPEPETQISDIKRMISQTSLRLTEEHQDDRPLIPGSGLIDTPESFDGISDDGEKLSLLEQQVIKENRRARKLEHEMALLKAEFEDEKKQLQHMVKDLKQELHRTAPLHDNKFFSLSKELRSAMDEISSINSGQTPEAFVPQAVQPVFSVPPSAPTSPPQPESPTPLQRRRQR
jgi:hypothetical protein